MGYVTITNGVAGTYTYESAAASAVSSEWAARVFEFTLTEETELAFIVMNNKTGHGASFLVDDFIYCKPGRFDHLEGFDEMVDAGYMTDYYLFKWKGAEFDTIENSGDRIAGFTVWADSLEALQKKHEKIRQSIKVIDENGNDMMRHDLLEAVD